MDRSHPSLGLPLQMSHPEQICQLPPDVERECVGMTTRARSVLRQLESRGPVPPDLWGGDAARRALAADLGVVIRNTFHWPNEHFLPDDPMALLLFDYLGDGGGVGGFEAEEFLAALEARVGRCLSDEELEALLRMTFGEFVDAVATGEFHSSSSCPEEAVFSEAASMTPESQSCPALAVFVDLRKHLSWWLEVAPSRVRPSTQLRKLLLPGQFALLDCYLLQRFGVESALTPWRVFVDRIRAGLWGSAITGGVWLVLLTIAVIIWPVQDGDYSMFILPPMFFVLGLAATLFLTLPMLLAPRWVWISMRTARRVRTVGDVVKLVLARRKTAET